MGLEGERALSLKGKSPNTSKGGRKAEWREVIPGRVGDFLGTTVHQEIIKRERIRGLLPRVPFLNDWKKRIPMNQNTPFFKWKEKTAIQGRKWRYRTPHKPLV